MQAFTTLDGLVVPLDRANVDTDAIIPKQFLNSIKRTGFGPNLFDAWRYLDRGAPGMDHGKRPLNTDFVLNHERYEGAEILIAGRNFGCGSSRETAAENLKVLGVSCVVAESFARIFMRNAVAVGLPVLVCTGVHEAFGEGDGIEIDLASGRVRNPDAGTELEGDSLPEEMREILAAGGILAVLRESTGQRLSL